MNETDFKKLCERTRRDIVEMFLASESGHLPSALSTLEILVTLFFHEMKLPARGATEAERDRFILSKGHGCLSLYAALGRLGYFPTEEWRRIGRAGGILGGHPSSSHVPGVEISTGSLGMGPSVGVGFALAGRLKGHSYRTFCLVGDGECNEGAVWEAALSASQRGLDRFFVLIDSNGYQANGKTAEVWDLEPLRAKWEAYRFDVHEVDLRKDPFALMRLFAQNPFASGRPHAIICRTSKAGGLKTIEQDPVAWHNKTSLTLEEKQQLLKEVAQ